MHPVVDIASTLRGKSRHVVHAIPFVKIARTLLPRAYTLSVVLAGDTRARRLNKEYRKKDYPPNVLSFPLSPQEGEIILNVPKARREARSLGIQTNQRVTHLLIHGILHLKGLRHGKKMDALEEKTLKKSRFRS